ncbi:MAG: tetratricopeptide repeat protein, partial [Bacteroidota bacterium]
MIRCIIFVILCATVGKGVAQIHKNVDDLKTRLGMASHDTTRFKIYIDLSFAYTSIDMDSAFFYQRKAVDLRDAIPPIAFQSTIHNLTGVLFYRERNYDSSIYHYRKGLEINQKIGRTYGIALNYTQIGLLHYQLRDFDSAKHYYFLAKDLF